MRTPVAARLGAAVAVSAAATALAILLAGLWAGSASGRPTSAKVDAGVVDIDTTLVLGQGAGTGILLTPSGWVLTNNHVIRGATTIRVRDVDNGRAYPATAVGYSISADVALLKLRGASGLRTVHIGDSTAVAVGDRVTAVGNAGGGGGAPAVTGGRVTGLHRSLTLHDQRGGAERLTDLLETSAALQPGDSGGPLLNDRALVIGIDTAASFDSEFNPRSRAGFAIPIDRAVSMAKQIEAGHSSATVHVGPTPFLGVRVTLPERGPTRGALVQEVVSGAPADEAGLVAGDVITAVGGHRVTSPLSLTTLLVRFAPATTVKLRWVDHLAHAHTANVRLAVGPPQ